MLSLSDTQRRYRHRLAGPSKSAPRWHEHTEMFGTAYLIVQVYYMVTAMQFYNQAQTFSNITANVSELDLLWPVKWMAMMPIEMAGDLISSMMVVFGILSVFLWRFFIVRLGVCVLFLQFAAFANSYGAINHGLHEWFWLSFCFLFLPGGHKEKTPKKYAENAKNYHH